MIGRFKPGDYPLWGAYYFRWWLVRRFLAIVPTNFLAGTPMLTLYFRLLGARIGADAFIRTNDIDAPDLVAIGAGAIIGQGAALATTCVEQGLLRIGRCHIGAGAVSAPWRLSAATRASARARCWKICRLLPPAVNIPPGDAGAARRRYARSARADRSR